MPATFADTDISYVLTENLEIAAPNVPSLVSGKSVQIPGGSRVANPSNEFLVGPGGVQDDDTVTVTNNTDTTKTFEFLTLGESTPTDPSYAPVVIPGGDTPAQVANLLAAAISGAAINVTAASPPGLVASPSGYVQLTGATAIVGTPVTDDNEDVTVVGIGGSQVAGSLVVAPGVVVKLGGARIETTAGSGSQLIAEGTASEPIVFTSLLDTSYGAGGTFATTNNPSQLPNPGDWAGLFFGPATSASLDYAILQYAGGYSTIAGGSSDAWNPIEIYQAQVRIADSTLQNNAGGGGTTNRNGDQPSGSAVIYVLGAQPVIVNNVIQNNTGAAIDVNANALNNDVVPDWGRSTGLSLSPSLPSTESSAYTQLSSVSGPLYTQFFNNYGPLVRLNALANNSINGMLVRGAQLTTPSIWDDTDIAYVLESTIEIGNMQANFGGLRLQSSSTQSLVVKLLGANAGFTADGTPLDITDRIGGTLQVVGQPGHPVIMTSLNDSTVGSGFDPSGNPDNDTNNNPNSTGKPGDWQGLTIGEYSNDTNLLEVNEAEQGFVNGKDTNSSPQTAQFLGALAPNQASGNDTQRLGFEVNGTLSQPSRRRRVQLHRPGRNTSLDAARSNVDAAQFRHRVGRRQRRDHRLERQWTQRHIPKQFGAGQSALAGSIGAGRHRSVVRQPQRRGDAGHVTRHPGTTNTYYVRIEQRGRAVGRTLYAANSLAAAGAIPRFRRPVRQRQRFHQRRAGAGSTGPVAAVGRNRIQHAQ